MTFHGYTDADWGGDSETSWSTSSFIFLMSEGAVSWSSKHWSMVALSSTESEYIRTSVVGKHLQWLRSFLEEIGHKQEMPTELYCDNQTAIILCKGPQFWVQPSTYSGNTTTYVMI
jgi:hypothetical protein